MKCSVGWKARVVKCHVSYNLNGLSIKLLTHGVHSIALNIMQLLIIIEESLLKFNRLVA